MLVDVSQICRLDFQYERGNILLDDSSKRDTCPCHPRKSSIAPLIYFGCGKETREREKLLDELRASYTLVNGGKHHNKVAIESGDAPSMINAIGAGHSCMICIKSLTSIVATQVSP